MNNKFSYDECVEYILNIPRFNKEKSEYKCREVLRKLGNPHETFKVYHVAGTNGKGSTCAFLNNILCAMGKKVGLFTSPHLVRINERIKIDGEDISDEEFLNAFTKVNAAINELYTDEYMLTFFEYVFLIAVVAFSTKKVEYAIFEVGLGGRLDATNIFDKKIASIITSISMDHMEILGDRIDKIAYEKAGIIKSEVPVYFYGENEIVRNVIIDKANKVNSHYHMICKNDIEIIRKNNKVIDFSIANMYDRYGVLTVPFVMEYQTINATLAIAALCGEFKEELTREKIMEGIIKTSWPGRMEEVMKDVYVDGSHNYEGIEHFVKYVNEVSTDKKVYVMFSVVKEKEYKDMMNLIARIKNCEGFIVAPVESSRALAATDMEDYLKKHVKVPVYRFDSIKEAIIYSMNKKGPDEVLFCTGSLYMVGEIKKQLQESF